MKRTDNIKNLRYERIALYYVAKLESAVENIRNLKSDIKYGAICYKKAVKYFTESYNTLDRYLDYDREAAGKGMRMSKETSERLYACASYLIHNYGFFICG